MEKYLENGFTDANMRGLEDVVYLGFRPVFCAQVDRVGAIALLNDIIDLMPSH
jgi:hypothetical protein